MDIKQQRQAAESFAQKWAGRGYEKGDTAPYWLEFLRECLGVEDPDSIAKFEKHVDSGFPDVTIDGDCGYFRTLFSGFAPEWSGDLLKLFHSSILCK